MAVLTERTEASVDGIASPADVNLPLGFALLAVDVVAIGTVAKDELIEILHVALATHEKSHVSHDVPPESATQSGQNTSAQFSQIFISGVVV